MALLDLRKFNEQIALGKLDSLYLFFGEEVYLIHEALKRIEVVALQGAIKEFNFDTYFGLDLNVSQLKDTVETLPMMAERRLVVVKEAQEIKAKELEKLMDIISKPVDSCILILVFDKIDKRKSFFKQLIEQGSAVEFARLTDQQVSPWIQHIAEIYKKNITKEALTLLHERVGNQLMDINAEMQKLAQFMGERKLIEIKDVQEIVSRHRLESVFELAGAIGHNDRSKALHCLAHLLEQGEEPIGVMALVARHVRILLMIQEGLKAGLSSYQLSARVGVPPYFLKDYVEQSRRWPRTKLEQTHSSLLDTDRALKSSPVTPHIWLENFILKTCNR